MGDHTHGVTISRPDHTHGVTIDIPDHFHDVEFSVPDHTHDPQPGIFETGDVPSNVDLLINGSVVESNIGSGTFQTTIDVSGEMTPGTWNQIEVRSDSLGVVSVTPAIEAYKQISKQ